MGSMLRGLDFWFDPRATGSEDFWFGAKRQTVWG